MRFNGKDFADFGVHVDESKAFGSPEKDYELVEIMGRNGNLSIYNDRFKDITLPFPCFIRTGFIEKYRSLLAYLNSQTGYQRLETDKEPNHFRKALFQGIVDPQTTAFNHGGFFTVNLLAHPQRFLKSGEIPVSASSQSVSYTGNPVEIDNPSGLSAVSSLAVALNPIQTGTGDPSPSNVRPISGHNYASVGIAGKNLLYTSDTFSNWRMASPTAGNEPVLVQDSPTNYVHFPDVVTTTIQQAAICERRIPYFMLRNKTLTFSLDVRVASGATTDLTIQYEVYADATGGSRTIYTNRDFDVATGTGNWVHLTQTRTFTDDMFINGSGNPNFETCYVRASIWKQHTIGATAGFDIRNPQLEFGSTGTTFVASPSLTETMTPIGQTVYGGTLNVTTGVLTLTYGLVTFDGSADESWGLQGGGRRCGIGAWLPNCKVVEGTNRTIGALSNLYEEKNPSATWASEIGFSIEANGTLVVRQFTIDTMTTDSFKAFLQSNPMQVCYPLQTPQTVQLTPQQISLLTGTNYISSDGNVTVNVTAPTTLENPTLFESKPLIRVYGSGLLAVNNQYITVETNPFPYIDIDCDMMDAFYGANNANQYVSLPNDYIILKSGNNYIAYDGTVQITPRWYEV